MVLKDALSGLHLCFVWSLMSQTGMGLTVRGRLCFTCGGKALMDLGFFRDAL